MAGRTTNEKKREEFAEEIARLVADRMPKPAVHPCVFDPEVSKLLLELARDYQETKKTRRFVRNAVIGVVVASTAAAACAAVWEGVKVLARK